MKHIGICAAAALLLSGCSHPAAVPFASAAPAALGWPACGTVEAYPGRVWPEPDPGTAGWNLTELAEAKALFDELDSAAVMVVHRGKPVASWGTVAERYTAQSVRKALLNSLVGHLVDEGKLSTDMTLAELGIDDTRPALTQEERGATVGHLLGSRSGIFHSALYEIGGWKDMRIALGEAKQGGAEYLPGAYWFYNNWDFNALGTIVERAAGEEIGPLFDRVAADPIRMQDFRPADVEYTTKESSTEQRFDNWSEHRAYMFDISTRDLARYGLLYLGCGSWEGEQVFSADWARRSLEGVDTRFGRGPDEQETEFGDYGYLWQIDRPGSRRLRNLPTREPIYLASGNRGHFMLIAPYLDLVIAHQVATVGGVGPEAQQRRFLEGSPAVSESELERLFRVIIEAHPEAREAFAE